MKTFSDNGINFLKHQEGLRLTAYKDTGGVWTIGFGHTGPEVVEGLVWTYDQCKAALLSDIKDLIAYVNNLEKQLYDDPQGFTQGQFDALIDLLYNWGQGHFDNNKVLKNMILNNVNDPHIGDYWKTLAIHDANGNVLEDLINRRKGEVAMYFS